ncbi:hypothetical protein FM119_08075 [Mycetocola reblochoni REB411]|uniref:Helicase/secretion neighborhood TadE-like protein n=1 Tax=Mycetocola reblochoni REB411 TaxID=1255698 RepID=A0A1R4JLH8_9MICO|nr:hypothetical protein FM119_08075 [Mycetocola reblochoni REB411]
MVAVAVALTAIILGAATALQHSGAVARAADLGALVAADTLFGHHGGEPCANARIVVESNGAELISCTIGHDARVVARRQILGIPFTRSARAG